MKERTEKKQKKKQNKIKSKAVWFELSNKIRRKGRRLTTEKKEKEENENKKK